MAAIQTANGTLLGLTTSPVEHVIGIAGHWRATNEAPIAASVSTPVPWSGLRAHAAHTS